MIIKLYKDKLFLLLFQAFCTGFLLAAMLVACIAGTTGWIIALAILGLFQILLLILNIRVSVKSFEPEKHDIETVKVVVWNILTEVDLKESIGEEFTYGELMDRIEERYKQYYKED